MTTLADLIARTQRHLYSGETRDERDRLTSSVVAGDTTLALEYARPGVTAGATLAVDLEEMYVWEQVTSGAIVSRGEGGSTAASHAANAHVLVNPKFSPFAIMQAINEELATLPGEGLFRVRNVDITYAPGQDAYDLTGVTDLVEIVKVDYDANDGTERWSTLYPSEWTLRRDMPTTDFPSGLALTINGYVEPGAMRVTYRAPFTALSATTDNVATVAGLEASAHDILPLGAAIRLTVGNEVSRNSLDQYETRRADEVGAGSRMASMRMLVALRQQRIVAEKARLYAQYPTIRR